MYAKDHRWRGMDEELKAREEGAWDDEAGQVGTAQGQAWNSMRWGWTSSQG